MRLNDKVYLGDGVYVRYLGYGLVIELTTENGYRTTNRIVLEELEFRQLNEYRAKLEELVKSSFK